MTFIFVCKNIKEKSQNQFPIVIIFNGLHNQSIVKMKKNWNQKRKVLSKVAKILIILLKCIKVLVNEWMNVLLKGVGWYKV